MLEVRDWDMERDVVKMPEKALRRPMRTPLRTESHFRRKGAASLRVYYYYYLPMFLARRSLKPMSFLPLPVVVVRL
jgi:hypothetical protein